MKTIYWANINSTRTGIPEPDLTDSVDAGIDISPLAYPNPETLKLSLPKSVEGMAYLRCPAYTELSRNTFVLKLPMDYRLEIDNGKVTTKDHNQIFFDYFLSLREMKNNVIQVTVPYIFICGEPLIMNMGHPYLHCNNITKSGNILGGEYDIGRWARPLNMALILHDDAKELNMLKGDVFSYVKFRTSEKINLKKFDYSREIDLLVNDCIFLKHSSRGIIPLKTCYDSYIKYNYHKRIIKEIKKNLI